MITRLHTALAVCVCVTGCVSAYSTPRPTPAPHPASRPPVHASTPSSTPSEPSGSSGQAESHAPQEAEAPEPVASSEPGDDSASKTRDPAKRSVEQLEVAIQGKGKSPLVGKVKLTELPNAVKVVVFVDHLEPGLHGVHIHQFADCSAKDAASAGPHFNPDDKPHGLPGAEGKRHLGDLGNLVANAPDGSGRLEVVVNGANLVAGAPKSLLNRSLVVHADIDDGKAQPAGNSGKRIGCAELTIAAAKAQPDGKVVWRQ